MPKGKGVSDCSAARPGNQNAVTHGGFSAPERAERRAAAQVREIQHREWMAAMPKTDYATICTRIHAKPHGDRGAGDLKRPATREGIQS
jgi:uncharacterized protein YjcR